MRYFVALLLFLLPASAFAQQAAPAPGPNRNLSGTVTAGGTFQQISGANFGRKSIEFQNTNAVNACYFYMGSGIPTTATSIYVPAGWYYLRSAGGIPSDPIKVTCVGTADTFYASEE